MYNHLQRRNPRNPFVEHLEVAILPAGDKYQDVVPSEEHEENRHVDHRQMSRPIRHRFHRNTTLGIFYHHKDDIE